VSNLGNEGQRIDPSLAPFDQFSVFRLVHTKMSGKFSIAEGQKIEHGDVCNRRRSPVDTLHTLKVEFKISSPKFSPLHQQGYNIFFLKLIKENSVNNIN
jgi:hypothetical protein